MATIEQLSAALVKADAAGNAADAKMLADEIRRMQSATPELPAALQRREAIPGPRMTAGQQAYQAIRPYAAPVVEMLGGVGGALVGGAAGTPFGPVGAATGAVGGAGLGTGIAKELVELADVYLGGKAPRQGLAQVTEPAKNIAVGATFEAGGRVAGPLIGKGLSKTAGAISDLRRVPQNKAAEIARNALGPDLPEVLNTLKAAQGQGVSAAQATADINSPVWQSLIERATRRDPRFMSALEQSQGEVSINALANLAGGTTATQTRAAAEAQKRGLTTMTEPMRQTAIKGADIGQDVARISRDAGRLEAEAAGQVEDVRRLVAAGQTAEEAAQKVYARAPKTVVSGQPQTPELLGLPRVPGRYTYQADLATQADNWASQAAQGSLDAGRAAREANAAVEALTKAGFKPLESAPLIQRVGAIARNPEFAGNDVMQAAVTNLQKDLAAWTNVHGIIPASALDAIRKNSVNAAVRDLIKGDPVAQKKAAAEVLTRLRPMLIDAIEGAGGKGYREYLDTYAQGMQKIAEKKLSGEALALWKKDKDAFVKLVQGESPEVVEKFLGPGRYDIASELAENTMATLREQAQKHITNLAVEKQASAGKDALKELLLQNMSKFRLPSYLSAISSTTNKALDIIETKIGQKTMQTLTDALKTPEAAANLLESLPATERNRVLQLIGDPSQWRAGALRAVPSAGAAAINALTPEQSQNALAQ